MICLGGAFASSVALAQMPSTPAPQVPASVHAPAGAPGSSGVPDLANALQPSQIVYAPRLPTPEELADVAKMRGLAIERIEQAANQITVAYRSADGQLSVVGYQLLPNAAAAPQRVVAPSAPTVIYRTSPRVVYYDSIAYDPWFYAAPVAIGIGIGLGHHHHHHGHFGGWRHHRWHR